MPDERGRSGVQGRPGEEETDEHLIAQARAGDGDAFTMLVQRHSQVAFRAAHVILGDADAASDAAQEGFISVYRNLGRFRAGEPFRPWLLRIVGNRARNLRRAAGRRTAATLRLAGSEIGGQGTDPDQTLANEDRRRQLTAAVNALEADDRAVLACRYFLDLSEAETAGLLSIRRGTVKSRLSRARGRLRRRLEMADGGPDG